MSLAAHLGMTLAEERVRVSREERMLWQAMNRLDPWGEARADLRTATVACVIANSNRGKNSKGFTPKDFMPDFSGKQERVRQSNEQMANVFRGYMERHNACVDAKEAANK